MSEHDWKHTPTLDEFNALNDKDDGWWWRIACGHHQNLYEAAVERYRAAEAQIQAVRALHRLSTHVTSGFNVVTVCAECGNVYPCRTIRAIEGVSDE